MRVHSGTALEVKFDENADAGGYIQGCIQVETTGHCKGDKNVIDKYRVEYSTDASFVQAQSEEYDVTHTIQKVTTSAYKAPLLGDFSLAYGDFVGDFTELLCSKCASGRVGENKMTFGSNLKLVRGDYFEIAGQKFRVSTNTSRAFNNIEVPLASFENASIDAMLLESTLFEAGYPRVSDARVNSNLDVANLDVYGLNTNIGECTAVQGQPGDGGASTVLVMPAHTPQGNGGAKLARGDYLRVGDPVYGEVFRVSTNKNRTFTSTSVPLASVEDPLADASFVGASLTSVPCFKRQTTRRLDVFATATDVKLALEELTLVGNVDVTRTINGNGYDWTVTFTNERKPPNGNHKPGALFANGFNLHAVDTPGIKVVGQQHVVIDGLATGALTFVRVAAHNGLGLGEWRATNPISMTPVDLVPPHVVRPLIEVMSSSEIMVQWSAPRSTGGKPVTKYEVEWDTAADFSSNAGRALGHDTVEATTRNPINDRQIVRVSGEDDGTISGFFVLSYDGQRTRPLPWDISAVEMQLALFELATVGDVRVKRNKISKGYVDDDVSHVGYTWDVHFDASKMTYPGVQYGYLMADSTGLRGTQARASVAQKTERQEIVCLAGETGTTRFSLFGEEMKLTEKLAADAKVADVYIALRALLTRAGRTFPDDQSTSYPVPHPANDVTVSVPTGENSATLELCNGASIALNKPFVVEFNKAYLKGANPIISVLADAGKAAVAVTREQAGGTGRMGTTEFVVGRQMFNYRIRNLLTTAPYYVRVAAYNVIGFGEPLVTNPERLSTAALLPTMPQNVALQLSSSRHVHNIRENAITGASTALNVTWSAPITSGGPQIDYYIVEWDRLHTFDSTCQNRRERQRFNITGNAGVKFRVRHADYDVGNFAKQTGKATDVCLTLGATAADVQAALNSDVFDHLGVANPVSVTRCAVPYAADTLDANKQRFSYVVSFDKIPGDVKPLVVTFDGCNAGGVAAAGLPLTADTLTQGVAGPEAAHTDLCEPDYLGPEGSYTVPKPIGAQWPERVQHEITGLMPGEEYFVRVAAGNNVAGTSPFEFADPLFERPRAVPGIPTVARLMVNTDTSLRATWETADADKAEGNNGDPTNNYEVEWVPDGRVYEQQTVAVSSTGMVYAGQYRLELTYNDESLLNPTAVKTKTTICIDFNAPPSMMKRALETIPGVDHVTVARSGDGTASSTPAYGFTYVVSFDGEYLNGPRLPMEVKDKSADANPLNGCAPWVSDGTPSVGVNSIQSGVAGGIQEIVSLSSVSTTVDGTGATGGKNIISAGAFRFSVGYLGDYNNEIRPGNGISVRIMAGSRWAKSSEDLTGDLNRGDSVKINGEIFLVSTDPQDAFDCEGFTLSSFHRRGAPAGSKVYTMDTRVGSVYPAKSSNAVKIHGGAAVMTALRNHIGVGDFIAIGNGAGGASASPFSSPTYHEIAGFTTDAITLTAAYTAETALDHISGTPHQTPETRLTLYKRKSVDIGFDEIASEVKRKIETLPDIGSVDVQRTGPTERNEFVWTVTFTSHLGPIEKDCTNGSPCVVADTQDVDVALTSTFYTTAGGGGAVATDVTVQKKVLRMGNDPVWKKTTTFDTTAAVNEVQRIRTTNTAGAAAVTDPDMGTGTPSTLLSGTFDILLGGPGYAACDTCVTVNGKHKIVAPANITAHDLKHELEQLPIVGRVAVSYRQRSAPTLGSEWLITFLTAAQNLPPLAVDGTNLVGAGASVECDTVVDGAWPGKTYIIPSLVVGQRYYAQVRGRNVAGLGPGTSRIQNVGRGMVPVVSGVRQQPLAPPMVSLFPVSSSQLELRWDSADDRGSRVTKYRVEWWSTGTQTGLPLGMKEVKIVRINNTVWDTQGYFTLTYGDAFDNKAYGTVNETTGRLSVNATAQEMKVALENLMAVSEVAVKQFSTGGPGIQWTITFTQEWGPSIKELGVDTSGVVGTAPIMEVIQGNDAAVGTVTATLPPDYGVYVLDRTDESIGRCGGTLDSIEQGTCSEGIRQVQTILTESKSALTGTFKLNVDGKRTRAIRQDATAAQVKSAIEAIGAGQAGLNASTTRSVEVVRHSAPGNGYAWYVTFADNAPVDLMRPEEDYLIGSDAVINVYETVTVTSGAQRDDISGYFRLHVGTERTEWLTHDTTAAEMTRALELLYGVGKVVITREDVPSVHTPGVANGYVWRIVCKVVNAPLNTFRAVPAGPNEATGLWPETPVAVTQWLGTGVTLRVHHPTGRVANRFTIGSRSEVQTITLKAAVADGTTEPTVAGAFKLTYGSETTACIDWHASAKDVETALEALRSSSFQEIDQVSVKRTGTGKRVDSFGYVFTITFWGTVTGDNVHALVTSKVFDGSNGCTAGANADPNSYFAHQNTLREGTADARFNHRYTALRESTEYMARVTALNGEGYGYAGSPTAALRTPEFGIEPHAPESLTVGSRYSGQSLSVDFRPPELDGGAPITRYRVEWDTNPSFGSPAFGAYESSAEPEVQKIRTKFKSIDARGGTFTLTWGGQTTGDLAWDCHKDTMASSLQLITGGGRVGINPIEVEREPKGNGFQWFVTFHHGLGDVAPLFPDYTLMEGYDPKVTVEEVVKGNVDIAPADYTFEQQAIQTSALSTIGGTFKLEFEGVISDAIPFNANKTLMKLAMEQLSTIYTVNVEVEDSYDVRQSALGARTWTVTFSHLFHESVQGAGDVGLLIPHYSTTLTGNNAKVSVATQVVGSNQLEIDIDDALTASVGAPQLVPGMEYYVRVAAFNSRGYGPYTNVVSATPRRAPGRVGDVSIAVASGASLRLAWKAPSDIGGAAVSDFKLQWYTAQGTPEVQLVTTSAGEHIHEIQRIESRAVVDNVYGFFTLSFRGEMSRSIPHNAAHGFVKESLELMSTIGTVHVTRVPSKFPMPGYASVQQGTAEILCTKDPTSFKVPLAVGHRIWVAGEEFTVRGLLTNPFKIQLGNKTDHTTPANFVGETVLPSTELTYYRHAYGFDWTVTFLHGHVGDQPAIVAAASAKPGEGWDGEKVTLNTITMRQGLEPLSGTFRLSYKTHTTRRLRHNATASEMAEALSRFVDAGPLDVTRIANGLGYNWIITFMSDLGDVPQIAPNDIQLTGPAAKMSSATRTQGVAPSNLDSKIITSVVGKSDYAYTIPSLTEGIPYLARVTARNSEGYGPHALSLPLMQTPREVPPKPQKAELIVMSDSMLKVVIHKSAVNGGAVITRYLIEWDTTANFANIATSGYKHIMSDITPGGTPYYYNVPALVTGTTYFFRVSAYNDQGYGPTLLTDPPHAKPASRVPGLPLDATVVSLSHNQVQVDWVAPSVLLPKYGGSGGRPISHYLIEWDTDYDNLPSPSKFIYDMSTHKAGAALSHIVGARDPMTGSLVSEIDGNLEEYRFRVTAYNADGYGNASWANPAPIRLWIAFRSNRKKSRPLLWLDQAPLFRRHGKCRCTTAGSPWMRSRYSGTPNPRSRTTQMSTLRATCP